MLVVRMMPRGVRAMTGTSSPGELRTADVVLPGESHNMADDKHFNLLIQDAWDELPEELREEFLNRRTASTDWGSCAPRESDGRRWEPLRPVVIGERAYRGLESLTARLLHLAVD